MRSLSLTPFRPSSLGGSFQRRRSRRTPWLPRPSQLLCFVVFFLRPAARLEGLIHWSLDEFPSLDRHAVNLHGLSIGAIMTQNLRTRAAPSMGSSQPWLRTAAAGSRPRPATIGPRGCDGADTVVGAKSCGGECEWSLVPRRMLMDDAVVSQHPTFSYLACRTQARAAVSPAAAGSAPASADTGGRPGPRRGVDLPFWDDDGGRSRDNGLLHHGSLPGGLLRLLHGRPLQARWILPQRRRLPQATTGALTRIPVGRRRQGAPPLGRPPRRVPPP